MSFHVYVLTFILSCTLFGVSWTNDFSADIGDETAVVRFSGSKKKQKNRKHNETCCVSVVVRFKS